MDTKNETNSELCILRKHKIDILQGEEFRPVVGYEKNYFVSNLGRVYSVRWKRIMKQSENGTGYLNVQLCSHKKVQHKYVHRLVADAFIHNPNNLPCVNHKDENRANNTDSNLEWCDQKYNMNYGRIKEKISKSVSKKIICVETGDTFPNAESAGLWLGCRGGSVTGVLKGRRKTIHGYTFKYANGKSCTYKGRHNEKVLREVNNGNENN